MPQTITVGLSRVDTELNGKSITCYVKQIAGDERPIDWAVTTFKQISVFTDSF